VADGSPAQEGEVAGGAVALYGRGNNVQDLVAGLWLIVLQMDDRDMIC
jgi:hypothetical protein